MYCLWELMSTESCWNGEPKFDIPKLLLQNLIEEGLTLAEISKIIRVLKRTLFRRMSEYNMAPKTFANIADAEAHTHVAGFFTFRNILMAQTKRGCNKIFIGSSHDEDCVSVLSKVTGYSVCQES